MEQVHLSLALVVLPQTFGQEKSLLLVERFSNSSWGLCDLKQKETFSKSNFGGGGQLGCSSPLQPGLSVLEALGSTPNTKRG